MAGHPRTREPLLGADVQTADPEAPLIQDPQEWRADVALRNGPIGNAATRSGRDSILGLGALLRGNYACPYRWESLSKVDLQSAEQK